MKIKICGLKRMEDVDYVNQCMPDFIGFVFAGTKRRIDFETAKMLRKKLNPEIKAVGVFVNEEIAFITSLVTEGVLDLIQLHGEENEEYIMKLRKRLREYGKREIPIIKSVRVQSKKQIIEAEELPVDFLLLDTFREDEYGGSGMVFDHKLIPKLEKKFILAGGITEKNVIGILGELKKEEKIPFCIDVSSSVEVNGVKDKLKVEKIVKLVHDVK